MSTLDRIAFNQGRRDEIPNQELARELAAASDTEGIDEIARNLWNSNNNIQADCLKVLYEIASLKPDLIAPYTEDFIKLLRSGDNRLVWGGMTALAAVAPLRAESLCADLEVIQRAMETGSVITRDQGVRVMAALASQASTCAPQAFSFLMNHLETCRPKDVPQHSESILPAVSGERLSKFLDVLQRRLPALSAAQARRVKKVIAEATGRFPEE